MSTPQATVKMTGGRLVTDLNTRYHRPALLFFLFIVVAHWAEHLVQAVQIWGLGWATPDARGVLGMPFPWLVREEWLHYGYALVMLAGLLLLRPGFVGEARTWWNAALLIQAWHHLEHFLLLVQAMTGSNLFNRPVPTSVIQLVVPRVELHLLYNAIVFLPMIVAMYLHRRPRREDLSRVTCYCAPLTSGAKGS
ncbi:hypothetical protein GCM10022225_06370 [Plantactinospora mayteni]|uniref:Uncharacterized protein n=1 Tax=Plantactinospora mayteni TaxID=566021 RepID=A0ABQ4ER29_9ACTN|nr:hypothetical protein [Plantactinospora mayteni]GIG97127.1 hypothetical protein Pma05_37000 [Plantactinospora mayteni]